MNGSRRKTTPARTGAWGLFDAHHFRREGRRSAGAPSRDPRPLNLLVRILLAVSPVNVPCARATEPPPPPVPSFGDVAVDPFDSSRLLVLHASGKLYDTIDRGVTWALRDTLATPPFGPGAISFDPNHRGYVYAPSRQSKDCEPPGLVRSTDGGASWRAWSRQPCHVVDLVFATDGALFARAELGFIGLWDLFRSPDEGETRTRLPAEAGFWRVKDAALGPCCPGSRLDRLDRLALGAAPEPRERRDDGRVVGSRRGRPSSRCRGGASLS